MKRRWCFLLPIDASKRKWRILPKSQKLGLRMSSVLMIFLAVCFSSFMSPKADQSQWRELGEGLSLGEFEVSQESSVSDSTITVLRIDPNHYSLKLMSASEFGKEKMTMEEWCRKYDLAAAINAGMYQEDELTSVGYMKNFLHVNNPRLSRDNTILAFNPVDESVPEIQIIDRKHQNFDKLKHKYRTFIQGIRMISLQQQNVWSQQPEKWSIAAVAMDKTGKVLFLFCESPYTVHDFIDMVLSLPISVHNAMYLEGGAHASMYVSINEFEMEKHGLSESGFSESQPIQVGLAVPNVIGVVKKFQ